VTDIVAELRQRHRNTTGLDPRITNPIVGPTIFLEAADEIERLRKERDEARRALAAWQANLSEPQEIDPADLQALIDAAWNGDRLTVRMSARDLWRMATDRRGREEE
jgi:hypothetical protein